MQIYVKTASVTAGADATVYILRLFKRIWHKNQKPCHNWLMMHNQWDN